MRVLEQLEPQGVFRFFEELCAIPHGSRNCQAVSDWCAAFARERGLECHQDQAGNVIIIQEATPGYEAAAPVILQGHLDMVCEKEPGCTKDMAGEGLDLLVEDGCVRAKGTTLGGDDGIAVAMALVQFANVPVLRRVARFYIWIFRGTPLLVQLFIVFYGLSRVGIAPDREEKYNFSTPYAFNRPPPPALSSTLER